MEGKEDIAQSDRDSQPKEIANLDIFYVFDIYLWTRKLREDFAHFYLCDLQTNRGDNNGRYKVSEPFNTNSKKDSSNRKDKSSILTKILSLSETSTTVWRNFHVFCIIWVVKPN
jgi:hypothetical protein